MSQGNPGNQFTEEGVELKLLSDDETK